ncbi:hypothetical protein [Streptomyces griseosporeus]|uniref:hypothetical protein n=1 Tax=Streptomyces griseosporeus TaxID=1910 RepID=UPI0037899E5D
MPRTPLPPPPPPPFLRTWPDRTALLADRRRALEVLRRRSLGIHRLLLLWLLALATVIGWALLTLPMQQVEEHDPLLFVVGPVCVVLGLAAIVPAVIGVVAGIRRDREIHGLLDAWLALDSHPLTDAGLRSPGLSLCWLLSSFAVCALGLWTAFATAAGAAPGPVGHEVFLGMGTGMILWLTGMLGAAKAVRHYRWALRALGTAAAPQHR